MKAKLWVKVTSVVAFCGCLVAISSDAQAAISTMIRIRGRSLVRFAESKMGQKVGRGECTDLVTEALAARGLKPGNFSDPKRYDWGTYIRSYHTKISGDIVQFEDVVFKGTTNQGTTYTWMAPHHTAIVKSVNGSLITIIHQNDGQQIVTERTLNMNDKKSGTMFFYRAER